MVRFARPALAVGLVKQILACGAPFAIPIGVARASLTARSRVALLVVTKESKPIGEGKYARLDYRQSRAYWHGKNQMAYGSIKPFRIPAVSRYPYPLLSLLGRGTLPKVAPRLISAGLKFHKWVRSVWISNLTGYKTLAKKAVLLKGRHELFSSKSNMLTRGLMQDWTANIVSIRRPYRLSPTLRTQ